MNSSTNKRIKVYSYLRVSTSMQVDAFSLDAQRQRIKDYADYEKMIIVKEYADEGISGKNIENRTQFKKMLNDIASKKDDVSFVLVFKLSRFGRNAADVLSSLQVMQDYGVNLICVDDKIDSSIDSGKLMISIMAAMAEIERENIRAFTMAGRKQKAYEGGWNGGFAPYGYRLEDGKLYIEEDEAETIRTIFDMYVNEDFGIIGIAKRLNALGIEKKVRHNGKLNTFSARFITLVLDNPVYKGYIAFGRRKLDKIDGKRNQYHVIKETNDDNIIVAKGQHEAIVSEDLWEKAHQKRIRTGGKKEKLEPNHYYILSGLIKCPYCGKPMYGVPFRKNKKNGDISVSYAYACRQTNKGTGYSCPKPRQFNCKDIDDQVAKIVIWQLNRTEVLEEMAKQAYKEFDVTELQRVIDDSQNKINALIQKKQFIERKIKELDVTSVVFEGMFEVFSNNLEEIVREIAELKRIIKEYQEKIKNAKRREEQWNDSLSFMLRLFSDYDNYSDFDKKKLMQRLVKSIEIYPTKRAYGYLKSIEFAFPVFKSRLTDERDTIYTIQDEYPDIIDDEGEFTDYDPGEGYEIKDFNVDENGCITVYPDETDEYESYISVSSKKVKNILRKETTDETVVQLVRI